MTTFLAAGNNPLAHVLDKPVVDDGTGWPLQIGTFMLVLGGVVTVLVLTVASGSIATGPESMGARRFVPRSRLGQLVAALPEAVAATRQSSSLMASIAFRG